MPGDSVGIEHHLSILFVVCNSLAGKNYSFEVAQQSEE